MAESITSLFFLIIFIRLSAIRPAFSPVFGSIYSYKSFIVAENDFLEFLWRFEIAILAASLA